MNRHGGHILFAQNMKGLIPGIVFLIQTILFPVHLLGQSNPQFDVSLQVDYSPAEQMLNFFDRQTYNSDRVANSRGNKIAAATSLLMARTERPPEILLTNSN